ncbi:vWA domain-containing protein [Thiosocius teredinicola]|uniref:vWA domain-containing protein n=1 Tax=Thiosocius teredinicola TaxID=1973002 RepID=UPI00099104C5
MAVTRRTRTSARAVLTAVLILVCTWFSAGVVAAEQPLLMPGKQSLFQRVLAVPGARLHATPESPAGDGVTPFTALYVYAREQQGGGEWLQVGMDRHGSVSGWLPQRSTIEWSQGLTVTFREAIDRDRALLFRDAASVRTLVKGPDLKKYNALYKSAEAGEMSNDSPVVAIQPPGKLDIRENFYLVPILRHEDMYLGNEQARLLQVSSVPLQGNVEEPEPAEPQVVEQAVAEEQPKVVDSDYRAGLVFAIDSTLSMDPYINRTREAVMKIYDALGDAGLVGNVNFGLVAFRDSNEAVPELEYLARTYVTLEQGRNPGTFIEQVNELSAAKVSSQDFQEDAYAGIKEALDRMNWSSQTARYLVLVTDAGPRAGSDPLSSTGMDAAALRQLARDKGVAIFVLHLLTESSNADHAAAADQYKELARFPGIGSLYYAVPTGDVNEFGHVLDTLAGQITMQVQMAAGAQPLPPKPVEPEPDANPQLAELQSKVAKLGYALRMQYLQRTEGGKMPNVFNAWLLDRDLKHPEQRTLDVQVLLTRDQLSDMHDVLKSVLQTAEEGLLSPQNFLNELKSLAATIARDPEQLGSTTAVTAGEGNSLADLGFMREYIEDLPYTGEVMNLSLEDWETWPARRQIDFLHRLEDKISYYRALHDHTDLWVSLDGGAIDGDSVFPVALEMLP